MADAFVNKFAEIGFLKSVGKYFVLIEEKQSEMIEPEKRIFLFENLLGTQKNLKFYFSIVWVSCHELRMLFSDFFKFIYLSGPLAY